MPGWAFALVTVAIFGALGVGRARSRDRWADRRRLHREWERENRRTAHFEGDLLDTRNAAHEEWERRRRAGEAQPGTTDQPGDSSAGS